MVWRQPQKLMGETLRAGSSLGGTQTPGVRRRQEERGHSSRALNPREEAAAGEGVLTQELFGERGP